MQHRILIASLLLLQAAFSAMTSVVLAGDVSGRIRLNDVAPNSDLDFILENSETPQKYQIEPMIAGIALFDFDNDGLLDVYVCNGAEIPNLEKKEVKYFNRLYRNLGDMKFADRTVQSGTQGVGYSMGVAAGDYDNDGWTDLYVTGVNQNTLYRNRGDGTFKDITEEAGVTAVLPGYGKAWSVAAGWLDYDLDGDLDLFVVNYCVWSIEKDSYCGANKQGYRTYCHPRLFDPLPNILYRNEGNGRFLDVSEDSGIGIHLGKGMGLAFADYDLDGYLDVFVSNDAWRNFLFHNKKNGLFEEVALQAGVAYIDSGRPVSGMGADFRDYDGDGLPDIFLSALSNETFPLFRNLGNGFFRDVRFSSGLGVQSLAWGGWSVGMVDFDNDADLDLFVAGGHVQTNEELYSNRQSRQSNRLFENLGNGSFSDATLSAGEDLLKLGLHRGAAFGDLDNDGLIDAVVTRIKEPTEVFRNQSVQAGHFFVLDLEGVQSNRDAIGTLARVHLPSGVQLVRHVSTSIGYGGSSDKRLHFGLGTESTIKSVEIIWPGGHVQSLHDLPADQFLKVKEDRD